MVNNYVLITYSQTECCDESNKINFLKNDAQCSALINLGILSIPDSTILLTSVLVATPRVGKTVRTSVRVSVDDCFMTYSDVIALFSSSRILVPATSLAERSRRQVQLAPCLGTQWKFYLRFKPIWAVIQSCRVETWSSSCMRRQGHSVLRQMGSCLHVRCSFLLFKSIFGRPSNVVDCLSVPTCELWSRSQEYCNTVTSRTCTRAKTCCTEALVLDHLVSIR